MGDLRHVNTGKSEQGDPDPSAVPLPGRSDTADGADGRTPALLSFSLADIAFRGTDTVCCRHDRVAVFIAFSLGRVVGHKADLGQELGTPV
jgi:hypothetical protein